MMPLILGNIIAAVGANLVGSALGGLFKRRRRPAVQQLSFEEQQAQQSWQALNNILSQYGGMIPQLQSVFAQTPEVETAIRTAMMANQSPTWMADIMSAVGQRAKQSAQQRASQLRGFGLTPEMVSAMAQQASESAVSAALPAVWQTEMQRRMANIDLAQQLLQSRLAPITSTMEALLSQAGAVSGVFSPMLSAGLQRSLAEQQRQQREQELRAQSMTALGQALGSALFSSFRLPKL